jgi:hypothetical protein
VSNKAFIKKAKTEHAVRLTEKTYRSLLRLKSDLIQQTNEPITFDDVVKWLLQKARE